MKLWNKASYEEQLAKLREYLQFFQGNIGGWPPRIGSKAELKKVIKQWGKAMNIGERLLKEEPDSVEVKLAVADLLRMGHNIDVPQAAQSCDRILKEVLQTNPENYQAHFLIASFYASVNPQLASAAEEHFLKAEQLSGESVNPVIYKGLGFLCVYQEKTAEAITYFEKFLQIGGDSQQVREIVEHLKTGKKAKIIFN